jgi:hypothetical protein
MSSVKSRTVLSLLLALGLATAQNATGPIVDVEKIMSASDFRRTGLQKLNADEMSAFNAWLGEYTVRIYNAASAVPAAQSVGSTASTVESQIEGEFKGWDGETIFRLTNGQIWQQALYAYTYHYAYRPNIIIYKIASGYRMKVDDVEDTIQVKRIK